MLLAARLWSAVYDSGLSKRVDFPGFFVGFGRISESAVCQGQPSCRTPGKSQKSDLPGSSTPNHPWQIAINCICQGRTRPFHPWQSPKNAISQGRAALFHPWQSSKNAVCQGQPSHRTPGKPQKPAFARVAQPCSTPGKVQKTRFARVNHRPEPLAKTKKRD